MKYPQSFVVNFSAIITSLLVCLINKSTANKEKLAKVELKCHFGMNGLFNIALHSKNVKLKKRDKDWKW